MDKTLKKHIWLECKYGGLFTSIRPLNEAIENILKESGGVMNGMDNYLSAIEEAVKNNIKDKSEGNYEFIYGRDIFPFETFFDECEITVQIHLNDGKDTGNSGGYKSGMSGWKENSYKIVITLNAYGNKETILQQVRIAFAHELTHAYDDFGRRRINSKADDLYKSNIEGCIGKGNALTGYDEETEFSAIYKLIYYCSKIETNAYIGQIKEELRDYFKTNPIRNSKDVYEAITHTQAYSVIKYYEGEVGALIEISEAKGEAYDALKQKVVNTYNKLNTHEEWMKHIYGIKDPKVNTARQVAKIITKKFNRFKENFYSRAPRIAYDTYMEMYSEERPKTIESDHAISEELRKIKELIEKLG